MRPTGPIEEDPPVARSASMSEYQNTPSPRRLTTRNTRRTGANPDGAVEAHAQGQIPQAKALDSRASLDMSGFLPDGAETRAMRPDDVAQHPLQVVEGRDQDAVSAARLASKRSRDARLRTSCELRGHPDEGGTVVQRSEQRTTRRGRRIWRATA